MRQGAGSSSPGVAPGVAPGVDRPTEAGCIGAPGFGGGIAEAHAAEESPQHAVKKIVDKQLRIPAPRADRGYRRLSRAASR